MHVAPVGGEVGVGEGAPGPVEGVSVPVLVHHKPVPYSAVQYSTVQYSTART